MTERIARELYIAMIPSNGITPGEFEPVDMCFGAYADLDKAKDDLWNEVAQQMAHTRPELPQALTWANYHTDPDSWELQEPNSGEVFAKIERVPLERRSAGDRRGPGR